MEGDIEWAKTKPGKNLAKNNAINKASKSFPWNVQKMKETLSYNINHQNCNWTEIEINNDYTKERQKLNTVKLLIRLAGLILFWG